MRAWGEGEWFRVGLDEAVGGVPAPSMVQWAVNELVLGANPAVFMYVAGPFMANILYGIGNEQQQHWASLAIDRNSDSLIILKEKWPNDATVPKSAPNSHSLWVHWLLNDDVRIL